MSIKTIEDLSAEYREEAQKEGFHVVKNLLDSTPASMSEIVELERRLEHYFPAESVTQFGYTFQVTKLNRDLLPEIKSGDLPSYLWESRLDERIDSRQPDLRSLVWTFFGLWAVSIIVGAVGIIL